ncbi:MAG TPA: YncE family protein [Actinomycetota bacterium]
MSKSRLLACSKILMSVLVLAALAPSPARALLGTPQEIESVGVGSAPGAVAHDPLTRRVFVGNTGSGTVSTIDERTLRVVATTSVGPAPHGLVVDPLRGRVYVAVGETNRVAILNSRTGAVAQAPIVIPQCTGPTGAWGMAHNPVTNILYVACYSANVLVSLNASSGTLIRAVGTGGGPLGLAVDPVTNRVWLGMIGEQSIRVLDGATLATTGSVPTPAGVWGLAFDSIRGRVFAANFLTGTITVIRGTSVLSVYGGFSGPEWISFDPVSNMVWVPEFTSPSRVSGLDARTGLVTPVAISGSKPTATTATPTGRVYSANFGNLSVSVISG